MVNHEQIMNEPIVNDQYIIYSCILSYKLLCFQKHKHAGIFQSIAVLLLKSQFVTIY